jgi:hypothetical protein
MRSGIKKNQPIEASAFCFFYYTSMYVSWPLNIREIATLDENKSYVASDELRLVMNMYKRFLGGSEPTTQKRTLTHVNYNIIIEVFYLFFFSFQPISCLPLCV